MDIKSTAMIQENQKAFKPAKRHIKAGAGQAKVHVKSIFLNQTRLEDSLRNIVTRKANHRQGAD